VQKYSLFKPGDTMTWWRHSEPKASLPYFNSWHI